MSEKKFFGPVFLLCGKARSREVERLDRKPPNVRATRSTRVDTNHHSVPPDFQTERCSIESTQLGIASRFRPDRPIQHAVSTSLESDRSAFDVFRQSGLSSSL
jgi:hypothetical protein